MVGSTIPTGGFSGYSASYSYPSSGNSGGYGVAGGLSTGGGSKGIGLTYHIDSSQALYAAQNLQRMQEAADRVTRSQQDFSSATDSVAKKLDDLVRMQERQNQQLQAMGQARQQNLQYLNQENQALSENQTIWSKLFVGFQPITTAFGAIGKAIKDELLGPLNNLSSFMNIKLTGGFFSQYSDEARKATQEVKAFAATIGTTAFTLSNWKAGTDLSPGTSMNVLARLSSAINDPEHSPVNSALGQLGVQAGAFKPGDEVALYKQTNEALSQLQDGYQKTMLVNRIYGSNSAEIQAAIIKGVRDVSAEEQKAAQIREEIFRRRNAMDAAKAAGEQYEANKKATEEGKASYGRAVTAFGFQQLGESVSGIKSGFTSEAKDLDKRFSSTLGQGFLRYFWPDFLGGNSMTYDEELGNKRAQLRNFQMNEGGVPQKGFGGKLFDMLGMGQAEDQPTAGDKLLDLYAFQDQHEQNEAAQRYVRTQSDLRGQKFSGDREDGAQGTAPPSGVYGFLKSLGLAPDASMIDPGSTFEEAKKKIFEGSDKAREARRSKELEDFQVLGFAEDPSLFQRYQRFTLQTDNTLRSLLGRVTGNDQMIKDAGENLNALGGVRAPNKNLMQQGVFTPQALQRDYHEARTDELNYFTWSAEKEKEFWDRKLQIFKEGSGIYTDDVKKKTELQISLETRAKDAGLQNIREKMALEDQQRQLAQSIAGGNPYAAAVIQQEQTDAVNERFNQARATQPQVDRQNAVNLQARIGVMTADTQFDNQSIQAQIRQLDSSKTAYMSYLDSLTRADQESTTDRSKILREFDTERLSLSQKTIQNEIDLEKSATSLRIAEINRQADEERKKSDNIEAINKKTADRVEAINKESAQKIILLNRQIIEANQADTARQRQESEARAIQGAQADLEAKQLDLTGRQTLFGIQNQAQQRLAGAAITAGTGSETQSIGLQVQMAEMERKFAIETANLERDKFNLTIPKDADTSTVTQLKENADKRRDLAKQEADERAKYTIQWLTGTLERRDADDKFTTDIDMFTNKRIQAMSKEVAAARELEKQLAEIEVRIRKEMGTGNTPEERLRNPLSPQAQARLEAAQNNQITRTFDQRITQDMGQTGDMERQIELQNKLSEAVRQGYAAEREMNIQLALRIERETLLARIPNPTPEQRAAVDRTVGDRERTLRGQNYSNDFSRFAQQERQNTEVQNELDAELEDLRKGLLPNQRARNQFVRQQDVTLRRLYPDEADAGLRSRLTAQGVQQYDTRIQVTEQQREADLMTGTFRSAVAGTEGVFTNFFRDVTTKGRDAWKTLGKDLLNVFNDMMAKMAEQAIIRPILGSIFNSISPDFARTMGFPAGAAAGGASGGAGGFGAGAGLFSWFSSTPYGNNLPDVVPQGFWGGASAADAGLIGPMGGIAPTAHGGAWMGGARMLAQGGLTQGTGQGGALIEKPTYFTDMGGNRLNVAGEAGTEAIFPLTHGPDGQMGIRVADTQEVFPIGRGADGNLSVYAKPHRAMAYGGLVDRGFPMGPTTTKFGVLAPQSMDTKGAAPSASKNLNVTFNVTTPNPDAFRQTQKQLINQTKRMLAS